MAKNKWKLDPLAGLTKKQLGELPDQYLNRDGLLERAALEDCNIFDIRTIAAEAGYEPRYFRDVVLCHQSSPFHMHAISAEKADGSKGRTLLYATHIDSARAGGEQFRAQSLSRQTGYEPAGSIAFPVKWSR